VVVDVLIVVVVVVVVVLVVVVDAVIVVVGVVVINTTRTMIHNPDDSCTMARNHQRSTAINTTCTMAHNHRHTAALFFSFLFSFFFFFCSQKLSHLPLFPLCLCFLASTSRTMFPSFGNTSERGLSLPFPFRCHLSPF
jgi:hypothetical protein